MVRFDLGPLLQGQVRIAKLKSAYNSLIIGPRGLGWQSNGWAAGKICPACISETVRSRKLILGRDIGRDTDL